MTDGSTGFGNLEAIDRLPSSSGNGSDEEDSSPDNDNDEDSDVDSDNYEQILAVLKSDCMIGRNTDPYFIYNQFQRPGEMDSLSRLLKNSEGLLQAFQLLDKTPVYDTHKFAVISFSKASQLESEYEMYSEDRGASTDYFSFLTRLGKLFELTKASRELYLGGLDRQGRDGKYGIRWADNSSHVVFHVNSLINLEMNQTDEEMRIRQRKRHLGNDSVWIIWNETERPLNLDLIKSSCIMYFIIITNVANQLYRIKITCRNAQVRPEELLGSSSWLVSQDRLAKLTRKIAMCLDICCITCRNDQEVCTNYSSRLRQIKMIKARFANQDYHPNGSKR
eukprot:CAMPEP_0115004900 /NCGR_PEP_ID=MMETSP0216-20121206/19531_1 /TAXON_ID=223996 /ORGANISM="Protocruzia adherens, Strain Boccale" /LENGTH=334 /DNA_ID=CAMNT_0002371083 /DNA_START=67 /DNA_END=1071 /DNA_ORIENTATION=+